MSIPCTCACGRQYKIADEHAGKRIRCKQCRQIFTVPTDLPDEPAPPVPSADHDPSADQAQSGAPAPADSSPAKSSRPSGRKSEWVAQVVGMILGIILVLLILYFFPGLLGKRSTPENTPTPPSYYQAYPPSDYYYPPAAYPPSNHYSAPPAAPPRTGGARPDCGRCGGSGQGNHCTFCGGYGRMDSGVKCNMCKGSGFGKCEGCFGYQGIGFGRPNR